MPADPRVRQHRLAAALPRYEEGVAQSTGVSSPMFFTLSDRRSPGAGGGVDLLRYRAAKRVRVGTPPGRLTRPGAPHESTCGSLRDALPSISEGSPVNRSQAALLLATVMRSVTRRPASQRWWSIIAGTETGPGQGASRGGRRLLVGEEGKITFVTPVVMLGLLVFGMLVANSGVAVQGRLELQNAADATAYSTALWKARSLNAITTANHLMGELTAVVVVLDSFGGKMLGGSSEKFTSDESKTWNDKLDDMSDAYITRDKGYLAPMLSDFDRQLVTRLIEEVLTKDEGKHRAGAAIYDAKITLKAIAYSALFFKSKANLLLEVAEVAYKSQYFAWAGVILEGLALGIHGAMSAYLVRVGIEWAYLQATEEAVSLVNSTGIRETIRAGLIPAISLHADTAVGSSFSASAGAGGTLFNGAVRETQTQLAQFHRLSAAETFPAWNELTLPVTEEEPPIAREVQDPDASAGLGPWDYPDSEWTGNFTSLEYKKIQEYYDQLANVRNRIRNAFGPLDDAAGSLLSGAAKITGALSGAADSLGFGGSDALGDTSEMFKVIGELDSMLSDLRGETKPPGNKGSERNPCINDKLDEELRLPKFYWQAERKTQWVRATYPYVDEYRTPVIAFFKSKCELSNAATYYTHWTNRYTLANSFEIRKTDDEQSTSNSKEKGLLKKLRAKVRELRVRFTRAGKTTEETAADSPQPSEFENISSDLLSLVKEYESRLGNTDTLDIREWFRKASSHQEVAAQTGAKLSFSFEADIEDRDAKALGEQIVLVSLLDELLTLLEDLLDIVNLPTPHMYVLKGMTPDGKGIDEPWITDEELAAKYFVVTAYVSRPPSEFVGSGVFRHGKRGARIALASAIVYNANGRDPGKSGGDKYQPNTGWDTLNWRSPVRAPEWGDIYPLTDSNVSPWELASPRELDARNCVELNWQAKLVPIRKEVLERIRNEGRLDVGSTDLITH